jgi:hypothetical protein
MQKGPARHLVPERFASLRDKTMLANDKLAHSASIGRDRKLEED